MPEMICSYVHFLCHLFVTVLKVPRKMNSNLLAIPCGTAVEPERQKLSELEAYNHACRNVSKLYRLFPNS